jgi:gamma-glutamyltranspeptidase/glutathione hydrolase/leukotriene-C4 hydrolase
MRTMSSLKTLLRTFSTMTNRTPRGAVAASGYKCAQIGAAILEKGGSAVDAAIASMLSEGVAVPNTMGLGGGFIMTVYIKDKGVVETLDAREVAPGGASEDMFCGDSSLSTNGGLAVAVPGELKGYWEVYKKYGGKVPWRDVVQPTIDLCNDGILVTEFVERVSLADTELLKNDECLRCVRSSSTTSTLYVSI